MSGAADEARNGLENLIKIIGSSKNPSKIQLTILEKIFEFIGKDLALDEANELGRLILNAYESKNDELAWAIFALKKTHLDFVCELDPHRLFKCWKETAYKAVYLAGSQYYLDSLENFSEREALCELREHAINFCNFMEDEQKLAEFAEVNYVK